MITGFDHIGIIVKDLNKSTDFFTNVLDFKEGKKFEFSERGLTIQFLNAGGVQLELFGHSKKVSEAEKKPLQAGVAHIALEVENLNETYEKLKARGVKFEREPRVAMMGQRIVFLSDPDGNRLELVEWPR